jgi:hypothetical protein
MNWRSIALVSSAALVVAAIAPWHDTVLGDRSGLEGDGQITSGLGAIAGLVILLAESRSRWLLVASVLGLLAGFVSGVDLVNIETAEQELFGEPVELVSAGWGLWASFIASVGLAAGAFVYRAEALEPSDLP